MELDKFEEFGEFEMEIEKGGEIILEKLCAVVQLKPSFNLRIGHMVLPIGLVSKRHRPYQYFTVGRSETELNMIPTVWHESGVEIFGRVNRFVYQTQLVNGLDSSGFSSANWVKRGHQGRFEYVNAADLAFVGRLDCIIDDKNLFGFKK